MQIAEKILKILMIVFLLVSLGYFTISVFSFINSFGTGNWASAFYNSVIEYSGIHGFTLAIVATYLGLKRLRLSYESNERTLSQLTLTQDEIQRRRKIETNDETLRRCEYYLTDIQILYKELIQNENYSGIPLVWSRLTEITRESLKKDYEKSHDKIQKSEHELKSQSLLTLYKLEAFCASFLHGNTDLELGKKMIGSPFCKQVGFLVGLIAYYRPEGSEHLFGNTLELLSKWEEKGSNKYHE